MSFSSKYLLSPSVLISVLQQLLNSEGNEEVLLLLKKKKKVMGRTEDIEEKDINTKLKLIIS